MPGDSGDTIHPALGWQQRRGGVRVYFCCCPFVLALAPFLLAARLIRYGTLRLLGRPADSPWAARRNEHATDPASTTRSC